MKTHHFSLLTLLPALACAESRTSTNYTLIQEENLGTYGELSVGVNYTRLSTGTGGGVSSSSNYSLRNGFAGQLLDPRELLLTASPDPVDEESTTQVSATLIFDDDTVNPGVTPIYTPSSGPIASVSPAGLVQTSAVYQDTPATINATLPNIDGSTTFTVTNTNRDNYEQYSSDGLPDDWQITHFGLPPNSDAGPNQDPDGDGNTNIYENLSGYDPTDPASFLCFEITGRSEGTNTFQLSKMIPGTLYTFFQSQSLGQSHPWSPPTSSFTVTTETQNPILNVFTPDNPSGKNFFYLNLSPAPNDE